MRPDGKRVKGLTPIVSVLPYIMPHRYDAQNTVTEYIDEEVIKSFIREKRRAGTRLNHMAVIMAAYYKAVLKNPNILLFDEATASVDSETEHQIQEAIEQMIQGRTTLMIAHRLSTLRKANKIIVVDKGKILEMGTPEELMEQKGKYYKLIQIQTMSAEIQKTKEEERLE